MAETYRDLEAATARLELIDRLAGLFTQTPTPLLPTVAMLCQGQIAPDFTGIEIGLAERLAARAVAQAVGLPGVQVLAHRTADGELELFTRRLERVSTQFPDVVELLAAGLGPREAILEGEVVAADPATGDLRPFQEVMYRRRKHGIAEAVTEVPVSLFCFDILYTDGEDLTRLPYLERRARLEQAVTLSPQLRLTTAEQAS